MGNYLLNAIITLFVTVDPVGLAPMFVAMTLGMTRAERRSVALRATIVATGVLVAFALFGQRLLEFLGISLAAFRISGGLLLFWIAFEMVFERRERRKVAALEPAVPITREELSHMAVVPLAIPLISGPGSISATILLSSQAPDLVWLGGLILMIALVMAVVVAVFESAETIDRLLGTTGRAVTSRLLGVILAALSVQFVADGVLELARRAPT
jgi:multiple antibiotic resistance protein